MFNKIFDSVKDLNYVKVTKSNWRKIEDLFAKKEQKIQEQTATISTQADLIEKQAQKIKELEKYKANDDMVYTYEEMCKNYKSENKALRSELDELNNAINSMDKKVKSALSLESAYLQRIIKAESKARFNNCPNYETKGDSLVEFYA